MSPTLGVSQPRSRARSAKTWTFDLGTTFSGNTFFVQADDVLKDRFSSALRGLGGFQCNPATGTPGVAPCAYYNPFGTALTGTGTSNSPDLIAFLTGQESFDARSDLYIVEGNVTRDLGALRGVPIRLAAGAEIRREKLSYDYDANANRDNFMFLVGNPDFGNDRGVEAAFVELSLPVTEDLNVQVAARYENYGDGVDSADPKISLLWRRTLSFSLRASAGTSFRAPSLFQAFGTQTSLAQLDRPARRHAAVLPGPHAAEPERRTARARVRRRAEHRRELLAFTPSSISRSTTGRSTTRT